MAHFLRVFPNTDLRNSHDGLAAIAKKHKVKVENLLPGEYLLFLNTGKNRVKLFAANEVVAYIKSKHGKIDMRTIQLIPAAFEADGKIDLDKLTRETLEKLIQVEE